MVAGIRAHRQTQDEKIAQQNRISRAEVIVEEVPKKTEPSWDSARVTLEAYFSRNLNQIGYIFWLSVSATIIGFGIIVLGIVLASLMTDTIAIAEIATLAGVITEFIGATFLFIYRSAIQQAGNYSRTLEHINSVGMAMQILDTIPDGTKPDDLKNHTKATLVALLMHRAPGLEERFDKNNN
jgi:hypothetical protein